MVSLVSKVANAGRQKMPSAVIRKALPSAQAKPDLTKTPIFQEVSIYEMSYLKKEAKGIWKTQNLSKDISINKLV